jgi:hypothetical protein
MGHVVGKGIELAGVGVLYGAKTLSMVTRGLFFMGGKHVDMVDTLKEMAYGNRENPADARIEEAEYTVIGASAGLIPSIRENGKIERQYDLIRLALVYGNRAYSERMLPLEEVLRVDRQAQLMAKAIQQYLKKHSDTHLKKEYSRKASEIVQVCTLFEKYHSTGNEQYRNEAERILGETI